ncbi:AraC family transcriptional regulator [Paenibacillus sp. HB172176]|uniref:AraC family transcriptional regulator n=1 Tax=Paenibacillus sp. HB172176 TaxID=2493690 RepID=UPI00143B2149|nr:AraC family transcriptional regulator [Paenibacillus sp. HB172176]
MASEHYEHDFRFNMNRRPSELSLLFSGFGKPMENHQIGPTVYDYYLIHTVISGVGEYRINDVRYTCKAGDTFFIFPGEMFSYTADAKEPWVYTWVALGAGSMAEDLLHLIGVSPERPIIPGASRKVYAAYRQILKDLENKEIPALTDVSCTGHLRLLLYHLGVCNKEYVQHEDSQISDTEQRIRYAESYMNTQFGQSISIEGLAGRLGYHRTYFSSLFKQHTGKSPKQYLQHIRMEQAMLLLRSTALSVDQIAASVGFSDSLYFSKNFHAWTGEAPTAYRKRVAR